MIKFTYITNMIIILFVYYGHIKHMTLKCSMHFQSRKWLDIFIEKTYSTTFTQHHLYTCLSSSPKLHVSKSSSWVKPVLNTKTQLLCEFEYCSWRYRLWHKFNINLQAKMWLILPWTLSAWWYCSIRTVNFMSYPEMSSWGMSCSRFWE